MPDGRRKGTTGYSTHPGTVANRARVFKKTPLENVRARAKLNDQRAIQTALTKHTKLDVYKTASEEEQRQQLAVVKEEVEKRR